MSITTIFAHTALVVHTLLPTSVVGCLLTSETPPTDGCAMKPIKAVYLLPFHHSYLNTFEESDLKIEEDFFKAHPSMGTFHNMVIVGTVIPPPQHDLSVIKVCLCV